VAGDGVGDEVDPSLLRVPRADEFEALYESGAPPWDIGRPQGAFVALADAGWLSGRVLDAGCGTGEHALMAAARGFETTGIDTSPAAIGMARDKALERGLEVRFVVGDALDLPALGERFDRVLDCGLFHIFDDADRARYVASLAGAVVPGGRCAVLCFSDRQPGDWGPRRVRQEELRDSFAAGWRLDSIEESVLEITFDPEGAKAWLGLFTRL
jgi:SAM-dependent methyltransferase